VNSPGKTVQHMPPKNSQSRKPHRKITSNADHAKSIGLRLRAAPETPNRRRANHLGESERLLINEPAGTTEGNRKPRSIMLLRQRKGGV
jgi:hypothetical protein